MKNGSYWASDVCLIVDANVAKEFLAKPGAITEWLLGSRGRPRLVAAGKLKDELFKLESVRRVLVQLERAGRLRSIDDAALSRDVKTLTAEGFCQSNDHHVLALARVSGARTLATLDQALSNDFGNAAIISKPRGKVYRDHEMQVVSSLLCKLCSLVLGLRFGAGFESAPAIPAPEPALGSHSCVALYSGSGTFQFRPAILALNALNPRGSGTESPIQ